MHGLISLLAVHLLGAAASYMRSDFIVHGKHNTVLYSPAVVSTYFALYTFMYKIVRNNMSADWGLHILRRMNQCPTTTILIKYVIRRKRWRSVGGCCC